MSNNLNEIVENLLIYSEYLENRKDPNYVKTKMDTKAEFFATRDTNQSVRNLVSLITNAKDLEVRKDIIMNYANNQSDSNFGSGPSFGGTIQKNRRNKVKTITLGRKGYTDIVLMSIIIIILGLITLVLAIK